MTPRRSSAIAYGDPNDTSTYVFIGGDKEDLFLHDWNVTELYSDLAYTVTFSIRGVGDTEADRASDFRNKLLLKDKIFSNSRSLTIASGVREELTVNTLPFVSPSEYVEVTATSGTFPLGCEGSLLLVEGTILRIFQRDSSNVARAHGAGGSNGVSGLNGETAYLLQTTDQTDESSRTRGYRARVSVIDAGLATDHKTKRTFRAEFRFTRPADDSRDDGRLAADYTVEEDTTGLRTVTFMGVYTGIGTNSAEATYLANFAAWRNGVLSRLTGTFQQEGKTRYRVDDELALATFTAAYFEMNERESINDFDSSVLSEQSLSMMRINTYRFGNPDDIPPSKLLVRYNVRVNKSQTTDEYLTALYKDTIRPHIFAQVRAKNDDSQFIIELERPDINPSRNTINVYLELELVDSNSSTLLFYKRSVAYVVDSRKNDNETWDASPNGMHKFVAFSPSEKIAATVTINEVRRNVLPDVVYTSANLSQGASPASLAEIMPADTGSLFQAPGKPPAPDAQLGSNNGWNWRGHALSLDEDFRGGTNPLYGEVSGALPGDSIYAATMISQWRWGEETLLPNPSTQAPTLGQFISPAADSFVSQGQLPELPVI